MIDGLTRPSDLAAWIEAEEVRVLNVAGNRESSNPGIGARVERFLGRALTEVRRRSVG